mgnify:CR=1 FL=1
MMHTYTFQPNGSQIRKVNKYTYFILALIVSNIIFAVLWLHTQEPEPEAESELGVSMLWTIESDTVKLHPLENGTCYQQAGSCSRFKLEVSPNSTYSMWMDQPNHGVASETGRNGSEAFYNSFRSQPDFFPNAWLSADGVNVLVVVQNVTLSTTLELVVEVFHDFALGGTLTNMALVVDNLWDSIEHALDFNAWVKKDINKFKRGPVRKRTPADAAAAAALAAVRAAASAAA